MYVKVEIRDSNMFFYNADISFILEDMNDCNSKLKAIIAFVDSDYVMTLSQCHSPNQQILNP